MNNKQILILNAGSSSIKYRLYNVANSAILADGICERITVDGNFVIKYCNQKEEIKVDFSNHGKALNYLFKFLEEKKLVANRDSIIGVGHRIVQGGEHFKDSSIIDVQGLAKIKTLIPLAPLHNEPEAKIIEEIMKLLPKAVNVGAFDTSFHLSVRKENQTYAIPIELAKKYGIRRYGFHGTSYKFITTKMEEILKKKTVNLIVCHLGNGASASAINNSQCVNTSMGLTPLEGLVMGTRSGNIDAGVFNYLSKQIGYTAERTDQLLNKESGLLGLCGSSDMRDVIAKYKANDPQGKLAMEVFAKRVADYLVLFGNDLAGKIDGIVFTAGIGENAAFVRQLVVEMAPLLKLKLNLEVNNGKIGDYQLISAAGSQYSVYVIRTNEELMIFHDVKRLLNLK